MWIFFKNSPIDGDVLDVRRLNENFLGVSRLFVGGLGEHNWEDGFVNGTSMVADDIGIRHIRRVYNSNPWASSLTNHIQLEQTTEWRPVDDVYYRRTFKTRGGEVEAIASFSTAVEVTVGTITPGISFALAVDGNVMHETIVGSGDESSDEIRYAGAFKKASTASAVIPDTGGYGPGIRGTRQGLVLSWRGRLPPGTHEVAVYYRNISVCDEGADPQGIGQGGLNIWEHWA